MSPSEIREGWNLWKLVKSELDKRVPSRRRWLGIAIFFGCVIFSGIYRNLSAFLEAAWIGFPHWMEKPDKLKAWQFLWHERGVAEELLFCAGYSYLICALLTVFIKTVKTPSISTNKYQALIMYLVDRLGIVHFYSTRLKQTVTEQDYASDMQNAVLTTSKVRMLCIAGYEYLGKGEDALLYKAINSRPNIKVEVIVLNPETGMTVINQRVMELRERDNTIRVPQIVEHIHKTLSTILDLNTRRTNAIDAYMCKWHPIFRLLICDDALFMSSYGKLAHGHETPVLLIEREAPDKNGGDTLYRSFENYFDSIKNNSSKV